MIPRIGIGIIIRIRITFRGIMVLRVAKLNFHYRSPRLQ